MIVWSDVFDEAYAEDGASPAELQALQDGLGDPLSADELREAWTSPCATSSVPFDPRAWVVPHRPLPEAYLQFLAWSNGGEFRTGERWFQFFKAVDPSSGVRAMTLAYELPEYMPGALPFAFNGGGVFYLFDMRSGATDGEYPILASAAGSLGWDDDDHVVVATTFEEACCGTVNVEALI